MTSSGVEQNSADRLDEKLDRLLKLIGIFAVRGLSQRDQIAALHRSGFLPREIAQLIGTTANTVRVALVSIRRDVRGRTGTTHSATKEGHLERVK